MPTVDAKPIGEKGWGCNCPDFRRRKADKTLFPSLVKAADVKVEFMKRETDGTTDYRAWTEPDSVYQVVYSPASRGGWCKHILACIASQEPFLERTIKQTEREVNEWRDQKRQLIKENKRLMRELKKLG